MSAILTSLHTIPCNIDLAALLVILQTLLILNVCLNYLYLPTVVFIVMVKAFTINYMKHITNITTPHTHATVIFIKDTNKIDVRYRASLISLFSNSCHHSPDTILGFLQIFVMQEEEAHQLHCHHSIWFLYRGFIVLVIIPQTQPFAIFGMQE